MAKKNKPIPGKEESLRELLEPLLTDVRLEDLPKERTYKFLETYANLATSDSTFDDFRLIFSQISIGVEGKLIVEQKCAITLTWEVLVRLRDMLIGEVGNYEKRCGKIRRHPNLPEGK